jgi:hypothetical protein
MLLAQKVVVDPGYVVLCDPVGQGRSQDPKTEGADLALSDQTNKDTI